MTVEEVLTHAEQLRAKGPLTEEQIDLLAAEWRAIDPPPPPGWGEALAMVCMP